MPDRVYFCFCGDNCKFETMTKEQILAAIAEATGNTVTNIDDAFITKIKEKNKGAAVSVWFGTEAEYNAITEKDPYCIYVKTDDKTIEGINTKIEDINNEIKDINTEIEDIKKDYRTVNGVIEWINPPMVAGTEYRTTERYNQKVVYTKCVNFGALPNAGSKSVGIGASAQKIVEISVIADDGSFISNIPTFDKDWGVAARFFVNTAGSLTIQTQTDMSSYSARIKVKYTKD